MSDATGNNSKFVIDERALKLSTILQFIPEEIKEKILDNSNGQFSIKPENKKIKDYVFDEMVLEAVKTMPMKADDNNINIINTENFLLISINKELPIYIIEINNQNINQIAKFITFAMNQIANVVINNMRNCENIHIARLKIISEKENLKNRIWLEFQKNK